MAIRITSKLSREAKQRLNERADLNDRTNQSGPLVFVRSKRYAQFYYGVPSDQDQEAIVRHMMTVAGVTFEYKII